MRKWPLLAAAFAVALIASGLGLWAKQSRLPQPPARKPLPQTVPSHTSETPRPVRLVAVGDIMMAGPMGKVMEKRGRGYPFAALKSTLRRADLTFGNLECCIATCGKPIPKKFNFQAHPRAALALHDAGFDIVSLANNHAWDYGREALAETVQRVRQAKVLTVGAGENRAAAHALTVVRRNGMRIGFLAYLGLVPPLIPESETEPSLSMGSVESIREDVATARDKADVLIVSLHCGEENHTSPTPRQRLLARAAIDAGADLVIGHHPHVTQPMEIYQGKPICYSLGNFVFSTTGRGTGAMLDATLSPDGSVEARLRPLLLAGAQPHFPKPMALARRRVRSVSSRAARSATRSPKASKVLSANRQK
ncbi:MAG TPA: CapA family protein [Chthonomonadaceae bacterium]|nr:CapA family protein [Chthonomonadaceae bacterium]